MATKQRVLALLKKQGATFEWDDARTFSACLPEPLVWDSGFDMGAITQEKYDDETWAQFWDQVMMVIDAPVITKAGA